MFFREQNVMKLCSDTNTCKQQIQYNKGRMQETDKIQIKVRYRRPVPINIRSYNFEKNDESLFFLF